jgi:hypothetical protein
MHKGEVMPDKISAALLKLIVEASPDGESIVIDKKDLLDKIREIAETDEEGLAEAAERLYAGGFINIVYQDEEALGVAPLPKGKVAAGKISISKKADVVSIQSELGPQINTKKIFQYAFMGALAGGIISGALLAILLRLI